MRYWVNSFIFIILSLFSQLSLATDTIYYYNPDKNLTIGKKIELLEDKTNSLDFKGVLVSRNFVKSKQDVPNLEISSSTFWAKFILKNDTELGELVLEIPFPTIDSIFIYTLLPNGNYALEVTGEFLPVNLRRYKHQNYIFHLPIKKGESRTYFVKIRASEQMQLPLIIGSDKTVYDSLLSRDLIFGLYAGIILVMVLYNLFLFLAVRDNTYLYYVSYILFVGLTQACIQGYFWKYCEVNDTLFWGNIGMVFIPGLVGIAALEFIKSYLQIKQYSKSIYNGILLFEASYILALILGCLGFYHYSQNLIQFNAMVASIFVWIVGYKVSRNGYRPALFFLIAWSIFLGSVIVFVLKNFNVLPYNNFTFYALQIGSALEVVLLSFSLADRINILKKEKEDSQREALEALQENDRLLTAQNVMLDQKVKERTDALEQSNTNLENALADLKGAQAHLVNAEKMASLGQLTAGVAHEINNPINFVSSSVKPLKRDVQDLLSILDAYSEMTISNFKEKSEEVRELKEEIDIEYVKEEIGSLLKGIEDGASRTSEIVTGLKTFSRIDETDLKRVDLNEGLDSTLIILNSEIRDRITITKEYGTIPNVECYAGKINQVFMNILNNAVFAVNKKVNNQGEISIKTMKDNTNVIIRIKDNGIGIPAEVRTKIFDPFFTTKDVGEGTGLGLSIVYNIIETHKGNIKVESEEGSGSEFIITLPTEQAR